MPLTYSAAYAQSKLAIIMCSRALVASRQNQGPTIISVNPGSLLGSKMVKDIFGINSGDIQIGADILVKFSLKENAMGSTGTYFIMTVGAMHPLTLMRLMMKNVQVLCRR